MKDRSISHITCGGGISNNFQKVYYKQFKVARLFVINSDEFVRYQPTMHRIQSHDGSSDQNEKVQQGWKFKKSGILTSSKSEFKDYN